MLQYLIKTGEKFLYGFGFGSGMGVAVYVLPYNKKNNLQNNYNVNDTHNILNQYEFQNTDTRKSKIDKMLYKDNTQNTKIDVLRSDIGWGWYYKQ